jgi:hypothetical protein
MGIRGYILEGLCRRKEPEGPYRIAEMVDLTVSYKPPQRLQQAKLTRMEQPGNSHLQLVAPTLHFLL